MSLEQPVGRASDQERDLAATVVQQAFADGRLDADEFDERINHVYAAKTRSELAVLTQDLAPAAHGRATETLTLTGKWSDHVREGRWAVPARIVIKAGHGDVRLDFTRAVVSTLEVLVEVETKLGRVTLVVPEGWIVDVDDVYTKGGEIRNKAVDPRPGATVLRVTGRTGLGDVVVRHPRPERWWRRNR